MAQYGGSTGGDVQVIARDRCDLLGEGPLWSARDDALYWTDILGGRINRKRGADDVESWLLPGHAAWVVERAAGGLACGVDRRVIALDGAGRPGATLADFADEPTANRLNDAKVDRHGRIWAGTMPVVADEPTGAFYRLDPGGVVARVDAPYTIPNGPAIAPDGSFLLHTDTALGTIFRFRINDDGSLGPRTVFLRFEPSWGSPDGMTFDADGCLWVACWGASRVIRFDPAGKPERHILLPASQITSCAFAGPALDRMFVTSASVGVDEELGGALFEVNPGCRGLPSVMFAG